MFFACRVPGAAVRYGMRRARKSSASLLLLTLLALQSSHVFGFHFHVSRPGERAAQPLVAHVHGFNDEDSTERSEAALLAAHRQSRSAANSGLCKSECACTHHEIAAFSLLKSALAHLPGLYVAAPRRSSALRPLQLVASATPAPEPRWTFRPHGFSPQSPRGPPSVS